MIYGDWIGRWGRSFRIGRPWWTPSKAGGTHTKTWLEEINRMAGFLGTELGVEPGDRVACLSFNRAEIITLFFAVGRLGAILVPLNFRLARGEFFVFF